MESINNKMIMEIAADHALYLIQVSHWKRHLLKGASELLPRGKNSNNTEEG